MKPLKLVDNKIISPDSNFQGFVYDIERNVCTPTREKTIAKWEMLRGIFPGLVSGRTYMDIGAYAGFYCFKALEHGATEVIGLEKKERKEVSCILKQCPIPNLHWICVEWPCQERADVVSLLGIMHHLILKQARSVESVMRNLANTANEAAIVEWIAWQKKWKKRFGERRKSEYSLEGFLVAARKTFSWVTLYKVKGERRMFILTK